MKQNYNIFLRDDPFDEMIYVWNSEQYLEFQVFEYPEPYSDYSVSERTCRKSSIPTFTACLVSLVSPVYFTCFMLISHSTFY